MAEHMVKNLRPGQWFLWASRTVRFVKSIDHGPRGTKHVVMHRTLVVTADGTMLELHYDDQESVEVVDPPLEKELARISKRATTGDEGNFGRTPEWRQNLGNLPAAHEEGSDCTCDTHPLGARMPTWSCPVHYPERAASAHQEGESR